MLDAISTSTHQLLWQYHADANLGSSVAIAGDTVYLTSQDGQIAAIAAGTASGCGAR
jgi:outer membrane protein assembly factor BamB